MHGSPWVFIAAAISLVPLAGLIGLGTEQLARRSGPALGGFLNATFGNAAELIIAIVALQPASRRARQSLDHRQHRRQPAAGARRVVLRRRPRTAVPEVQPHGARPTRPSMLFLAVVALVMPAVFDLALYGTLAARPPAIDRLSLCSAFVLIVAYAGQPDLRVHDAARSVPHDASGRARRAGARARGARRAPRGRHDPDDDRGRDSRRRAAAGARRSSASRSSSSASSSSRSSATRPSTTRRSRPRGATR